MAAVFSDLDVEEEMTIVQSVSGGPRARGSALGLGGGKGWRLRGRIYIFAVSSNLSNWFVETRLTPGLLTLACKKLEKQIKKT
jgi:hypothetical protein